MSVIDSLVIELGLDASKMSKGQKQAMSDLRKFERQADKTGQDVADSGAKAASFFSSIRREALGMFAVFTAGRSLKAFISDTTKVNAQLGYMSHNLGIPAQNLYRMETAAQAAGGAFGEVAQTYSAMQEKLSDPTQLPNIAKTFSLLGVGDWQDGQTGNMRTDIVGRLNKAIHANHMNAGVAAGYMRDLGLSQGMINEALMDPSDLARIQRNTNAIPTPTPQDLHNSQKLYQDLVLLQKQSESEANILTSKLAPSLDNAVNKMLEWERENPNVAAGIGLVTIAIRDLNGALNGFGGILAGLIAMKGARGLLGLLGEVGGTARAGATVVGGATRVGTKLIPGLGILYELLHSDPANANEGAILNKLRNQGAMGPNATGSVTKSTFFNALVSGVTGIEHARYDQMGGAGGKYAGRYQMGRGAIADAARWLREPVPTQEQFLADPAMQDRFFKAYTASNEATLNAKSDAFRAMSTGQKLAVLGYAHNQGAGGAVKWLKTGVSGQDAFGTDGTRYSAAVMKATADMASSKPAAPINTTTVNVGDIHIDGAKEPHAVAQEMHRTLLSYHNTTGVM